MTSNYTQEDYIKLTNINIFEEITPAVAERVVAQLQYADFWLKQNNVPAEDRIITLQLCSPGGHIAAGLAIYDTMNYVDAKISTVAIGMAASMAAFLLAAGTKGLRKITEHSEVMIHQPLGGASGQASDIEIACKHIVRTRTLINRILSDNTGQPISKIRRDCDRDNIMTAQQAYEYGLVDEIIRPSEKAYAGGKL